MFITVQYVLEMMKNNVILDPKKYIIRPGLMINPMKINDMRPLLMDQIDDNKAIANTSAIVALKRYRNSLVKHNKTPADDRLLLRFLQMLVPINDFEDICFNLCVTAACPYPALRLDKLYAALIRCLVLWTVTKQFLVSCFKGLYLLTGGSDVTRGISCDSSVH